MEKAAAFLETQRYAAYVGATTEINRSEGIDIDPSRRVMYFSLTSVSNGMEANSSHDLGAPPGLGLGALYGSSVLHTQDSTVAPIAEESVKMCYAACPHSHPAGLPNVRGGC
jgi:uncharacterized protein